MLFGCSKNDSRLNGFYYEKNKDEITITGVKKDLLNRTNIVIPDCVTSVRRFSLENVKKLNSLTFPKSIKSYDAILNDNDLDLYYDGTLSDWCNVEVIADNPVAPMGGMEINNFYLLDEDGEVSHNGKKYNLITELVLPDGIKEIKERQFGNFMGINSVTIPDSVTKIGNGAFSLCRSLSSVKMSNNIETIGEYVFFEDGKIEKMFIPKSIIEIGNGFVSGSSQIVDLFYEGTLEKWVDIHFGGSHYPANLYIKNDNKEEYSLLENVILPNSMTKLERYQFSGLLCIKSINIPKSIKEIDFLALNCANLTTINYDGSEAEWNSITIIEGDELFTNATITFRG